MRSLRADFVQPVNDEDDYVETDLDIRDDDEASGAEDDAQFIYTRACDRLSVIPVTHLVERVFNVRGGVVSIDLSHHGLGYKGAIALAEAITESDSVEAINICGNEIG